MGWLSKLLGRERIDDDSPVVEKVLDQPARQAQLAELEGALRELTAAMSEEVCPLDNPGWRGRIRDYDHAVGGIAMLRRTTITKEGVFEVTSTIRPLFAKVESESLAHLVPMSDRVITLVREIEKPLPSER